DLYFDRPGSGHFGYESNYDTPTMTEFFAERGGDPDRVGKRDPLDALLWRMARPGEPSWESELGAGRPGWHIECSAIALNRLGDAFDVQGGGSDLVFPHHEFSAAHAEALTGRHPPAGPPPSAPHLRPRRHDRPRGREDLQVPWHPRLRPPPPRRRHRPRRHPPRPFRRPLPSGPGLDRRPPHHRPDPTRPLALRR